MYSSKTTSSGNTLYFKDGKIVSKKNIPEEAMVLDLDMQSPDQTIDPVLPDDTVESVPRICVVCGNLATHQKFIHMQTINLCEDDYLHTTTGEIVATMRDNEQPTG